MEKWASPCTSVSILMLIRSLMALILALVTVPMRSQTYGITMATALRLTIYIRQAVEIKADKLPDMGQGQLKVLLYAIEAL